MNPIKLPAFFALLSVYSIAFSQSAPALIPAPKTLTMAKGTFQFSQLTAIKTEVKDPAVVKFLTSYLLNEWKYRSAVLTGTKQPDPKQTLLLITEKGAGGLPPEGYKLSVSPAKITLVGKGAGLFYGIQTLIQLFPNERSGTAVLPCLTISDEPRFGYRGLMLDVSRHFYTVQQVKDLLDLMAAYKLNRFHWHLTDDQGWRLEIKSLPKLTEVGAWRVPRKDFAGYSDAPQRGEKASDGGFYTQDDVREVLRYAAERNIQVMPEIDVPGHSMAAIASYPELCVTKNPNTKVNPGSSFAKWFPDGHYEMYEDNTLNPADEKVYEFLNKVFGEVAALFPYEYIHIGGDECFKGYWEKDAGIQEFMKKMNIKTTHELQGYFISRVNKIVQSKNKKLIGWDEILEGGLNDQVAIMNRFGEKGAIQQAKRKLNIIMAPGGNGLYFDYAQSKSELEPSNHGGFSPVWKTYDYDPGYEKLSAEEKKQIMGVEACVWTEHIASVSKLHYSILPRMLALAEVGWTDPANKNPERFTQVVMPVHLERFDLAKMNYRVPTVFNYTDSTFKGDKFVFNLKPPVPGAKIFYTLNGRTPGDADHEYKFPLNFTLSPGKKYTLKTIVITRSGRRSVVTRTIMENPAK